MTDLEKSISETLGHYNHTLKVENNLVTIEATKKTNKSVRLKLVLLFGLLIVGIFIHFFVARKTGLALAIFAGISIVSVMNILQRETEAQKRTLEIGEDYMEVTEKFRRDRIQFDEIAEFQINTKMENKITVGSIIVLNEKRLPLKVVELIGKDEEDVSYDLEQLANYINQEFIAKE